jgi:hypothetical protein
MAKDWIAYWMARGETAERAAYLAKGSEALASHAVFRVVEIDQEGCQCDVPEREKCAHTFNVSVYSTYEGFDRYDAKPWKEAEFREHCGGVCVESATSDYLDYTATELAAEVVEQIEDKRLHDSAQACLYSSPACTENYLSARCAA